MAGTIVPMDFRTYSLRSTPRSPPGWSPPSSRSGPGFRSGRSRWTAGTTERSTWVTR
ncbi:hypothetical protein NKG94_22540 [Micromonospora sp. M12]